jgi:hypothetical protein
MRLVSIEFNGYKRLANTTCNVDGRLIAFLGPNEAGKSSVLQGLDWLTWGDEDEPLASHMISRFRGVADHELVVRARYLLDDEDLSTLADLEFVETPRALIAGRNRLGQRQIQMVPAVRRKPEPFEAASAALENYRERCPDDFVVRSDEYTLGDWAPTVFSRLAEPDDDWSNEDREAASSLATWLGDRATDSGQTKAARALAAKAADALTKVISIAAKPHPLTDVQSRLATRVPNFLLFGDEDRTLESQYNLSDANLHDSPPEALVSLLSVAGVTLGQLWDARKSRDVTRLQTSLKRANRRLSDRLVPTWKQGKLTVHLEMNGDWLHVLVDELQDDGPRTRIDERSDGLKTFLALVCFLAAKATDVKPILLIDEAETHLHYNAQADLIEVLLSGIEASQVIYTTHSPGCLPPDLGTGVRFVAPDPSHADASVLRADFWSSNEPGFSPLLFAMGAGAAAFSVCRYAVLAEGAADMILLPSLIRLATGEPSLRYQIAQGLAGFHGRDLSIDEVAARVAYLVDGDTGGQDHQKNLAALGVPFDRILRLPPGTAPEDLLDPAIYLGTVNRLLREAGREAEITLGDLDITKTIARAVQDWCMAHDIAPPGKVAVASQLIQNQEALALKPEGARALEQLHTDLMTVFGLPPTSVRTRA